MNKTKLDYHCNSLKYTQLYVHTLKFHQTLLIVVETFFQPLF
jgi:hypothetical protein